MRALIILSLCLAFSTYCYCQKCKFLKKEITDDVSKLPVLIQKEKAIAIEGLFNPNFYYSTNRCWIHLSAIIHRYDYSAVMSFNTKTPIIFHLHDQTSLTLYPITENGSIKYPRSTSVFVDNCQEVCYSISKEDVERLASKTVMGIKLYYSFDYEANKEDSSHLIIKYKEGFLSVDNRKQIQHLSTCILNVNFLDTATCLKHVPKKVEIEISDDERILELICSGVAINEIHYKNADEIQIGDVVKYESLYGDIVYGIVSEKVKKTKPKIKYYSVPGSELFENVSYKKLTKLILVE